MIYDLQKANMWKRISAWLFDMIMLSILIVGAASLLSGLLHYDSYSQTMDDSYAKYESDYGITFEITEEEYNAMSAEETARYDAAYEALIADQDAMYAYNMLVNLTLLITSLSILIAYAVLEFIVPLIFGNGQTLGKKIFGVAVMRTDSVKITTVQLFIRTFLGKYTVETMIPALIVIMLMFNAIGVVGTFILGLILLLQVIFLIATKTNSAIHDMLAGTVTVDFSSQMIFPDTDALLAYKKKIAAEEAERKEYY